MKGQGGFTLVEVLATGVISTVLAASIMTMLSLTNSQIKSETQRSRTAGLFEIAAEEFHRAARDASTVLGDAETDTSTAPNAASYRTVFFLYGGGVIGGFNIRGTGVLEEWKNGAFTTFKVGTDSLFVVNSGNFTISDSRRAVTFKLNILIPGSPADTLANIRETVLCRNTQI